MKSKNIRTVFIIPQQHFDPIWRKPFGEYAEKQEDFLLKAFRIMKKYPEFSFNEGQRAVLQRFIGAHPDLKRFIKDRIKNGKFEAVGGMEVIPDVNIPSGESLVRQALLGKSWAREIFNVEVETAWLYDTFGLSAQMPQILRKCGFKWLHAIRFGNRKDVKLPCYWEGLDGTRILTHSRDYNHNSWQWFYIDKTLEDLKNLKNINKFIVDRSLPLEDYPPYYLEKNKAKYLWYEPHSEEETPSAHVAEKAKEWNASQGDFKFVFALPRDYFNAISRAQEQIPVVRGDLNPELTGVYSSRIWLKLANRELESALLTAEKLAVIAGLFGCYYPQQDLNRAWRELLFTHHHDGICGCHIDIIDEFLTQKQRTTRVIALKTIETSLAHLTSRINTIGADKNEIPVALFNPLGWARSGWVEMDVPIKGKPDSLTLKDARRQQVPMKIERGRNGNVRIAFVARDVPSLGYEIYRLSRMETEKTASCLKSSGNAIENNLYKITAGDRGIVSIRHKESGKELLNSQRGLANEIICEEDRGDLYVGNCTGRKITAAQGQVTRRKTGHNDVFAFIRFAGRFPRIPWIDGGRLVWQQETRIYNDIRRIDFITRISWRGENTRVSVQFPTRIKTSHACYEIPFGAVRRKPYEHSALARDDDFPAQNWVGINKENFGATLLNTGTDGVRVKDGIMAMTLLRTGLQGPYDGVFGAYSLEKAKGHGTHIFKYALIAHSGEWDKNFVFKDGLELNTPLIAKMVEQHAGDLPPRKSFFSVNSPNIVLSSVKRAETGKKNIALRIYEAAGKETQATLFFIKGGGRVKETNLIEQPLRKPRLKTSASGAEIKMKPFEIKTFLV